MKKDLIILVADLTMQAIVEALIPRIISAESLKEFSFDCFRHVARDSGIVNQSHDFLRGFVSNYSYAMVICDYEGCGKEKKEADEIEKEVEKRLSHNGWAGRNTCIVLRPELEIWLWVSATHLEDLLDWKDQVDIYSWLEQNGYLASGERKPDRPKEAFEKMLRMKKIPRSASLYSTLAKKAGYKKCTDDSLGKMVEKIRRWFPS